MNRNRKIADKYIANQIREDMKRRKEERKKNDRNKGVSTNV